MIKTAIISDCGKYRYRLERIWNDNKPKVLFIMLNPSTADANFDDSTIRRCISFANRWGFGGLMVGNLFAYRTTYPHELRKAVDPVGITNAAHLIGMVNECDTIVCAWGADPITQLTIKNDIKDVLKCLSKPLFCISRTKSGNPGHPLYLPNQSILKPYSLHDEKST